MSAVISLIINYLIDFATKIHEGRTFLFCENRIELQGDKIDGPKKRFFIGQEKEIGIFAPIGVKSQN